MHAYVSLRAYQHVVKQQWHYDEEDNPQEVSDHWVGDDVGNAVEEGVRLKLPYSHCECLQERVLETEEWLSGILWKCVCKNVQRWYSKPEWSMYIIHTTQNVLGCIYMLH